MRLLRPLRNRFWQWLALWACKRADASYADYFERYDPHDITRLD